MTSGKAKVSLGLLCVLVAAHGDEAAPRLDVPRGFDATLYASGIDGARDLDIQADSTVTLRGKKGWFEISPPTPDEPVTVMRVAAELTAPRAIDPTTLAVRSPHFVRLRWDARSGELLYVLTSAEGAGIPVSARTLALAHRLDQRRDATAAIAPDGSVFVADARAGAVWRIRRASL